jgi:hypothetical protein
MIYLILGIVDAIATRQDQCALGGRVKKAVNQRDLSREIPLGLLKTLSDIDSQISMKL